MLYRITGLYCEDILYNTFVANKFLKYFSEWFQN